MYNFIKKSETKYEVRIQDFILGNVTYTDNKWFMKAGDYFAIRSSRKKAVEAVIINVLKEQLSVNISN